MTRYEYRAIPAPLRGDKEKGLKTGAERFAHALEAALNEMGAEGWDYVRAETLPSEERAGLTGKSTVFHNLLIFRRAITAAPLKLDPAATPRTAPPPATGTGTPAMPEPTPTTPEAPPKPALSAAPKAR